MGVDETLEEFVKQWEARNSNFHLDNEKVREELVTLLGASMTVLLTCSLDQWAEFMEKCSEAAKTTVPPHIQKMIRGELTQAE